MDFFRRFRPILWVTFFWAALFLSASGFAQTVATPNSSAVSFTAPSTDVSIGLLQAILGDWTSSVMDPTLGALFKAYNQAVLVFGGFLFLYAVTVGTLASAEDGEALGKRWSSAFVPLRVAGGILALFPMANGFSLVQIFVLWLATAGVGGADWLASTTINNFVANEPTIVASSLVKRDALAGTITEILRAETCVAEHNRNLSANGDTTGTFTGPTIIQGIGSNTYARISWGPTPPSNYAGVDGVLSGGSTADGTPTGLASSEDLSANACGSIEVPNYSAVAGMGNGASGTSNVISHLSNFFSGVGHGVDLNNANIALRNAHFSAIATAAADLRPIAQAFVAGSANPQISVAGVGASNSLAVQIAGEVSKYQASIAHAMSAPNVLPTSGAMSTAITSSVNQNGWAVLGTFFYQYARIGSELSKMTSYKPNVKFPTEGGSASADMEANIIAALKQSAANPLVATQIQTAGSANGGINGLLSGAGLGSTSQYLGEAFGVDSNNPENAIIQLKNVGDNILSAAEVMYVGKKVFDASEAVGGAMFPETKAAGFLVKIFKGTSDDAFSLASFVFIFGAFTMLGFGMTLAFWIPMSPFILWLGAICGWVIAVLEMVVAAPLWAAAHIHPEGEMMSSKYGANGYMIVLEVFAKPILCVIGFFIAAQFVDPFLRFSSILFFNSMTTVNADSFVGLLTSVAFIFMYVGFCVALVNRCFTLIHVIPNSVLRWVGGGGDRFTDVANIASELEGKSQGGFRAVKDTLVQSGEASAVAKKAKQIIRPDDSNSQPGPKNESRNRN